MLKAKIYRCPNFRMSGIELRRLRVAANMSEDKLAILLGTYRQKIQRWEKKKWFEVEPGFMQGLLKVLGASSL